jgi:hypothetical protein
MHSQQVVLRRLDQGIPLKALAALADRRSGHRSHLQSSA